MIVISCGMKRAGSTVQYQITSELIKSAGKGKDLGFISEKDFGNIKSQYLSTSEIVVLKTHDYLEGVREIVKTRDIKVIYIFRDIRDVTVSFMNKGNRPFHRFLLGQDIDEIIDIDHQWKS